MPKEAYTEKSKSSWGVNQGEQMIDHLRKMSRELTPTEHLILQCVCTGNSNASISERTHFSIKTVENVISRSARVFGIYPDVNINLRLLLALAYRANFQNVEFNSTELALKHLKTL